MKFTLLLLAGLACTLTSMAQTQIYFASAPVKYTEAAPAEDKSAALVTQQSFDLKSIRSIKFELVKTKNLATQEITSGIKVIGYTTKAANKRIAYLTSQEVDGLLKAITFMHSNVLGTYVPEKNFACNYQTADGFELGAVRMKNKWDINMKMNKYTSEGYYRFKASDLKEIEEVLLKGKAMM
jgi:hypothetical protein